MHSVLRVHIKILVLHLLDGSKRLNQPFNKADMRAIFSRDTYRKWRATFGDELNESTLINPLTEVERAFCGRAAKLLRDTPLSNPSSIGRCRAIMRAVPLRLRGSEDDAALQVSL